MNSSISGLGKSLSVPSSHQSPTSAGPVNSSFESSRRPNQANLSGGQPAPRKGQASRKQHRNQRKPEVSGLSNNYLDYDHMAELRAVRNPSSRRGQTSITHLLDYTSPRLYRDHPSFGQPQRRHTAWGPGSRYHAVDKSRYVHANYRFIVTPEGKYGTHASDADVRLEWADVLQIIASAQSQTASCPICLSEPVAPRMAKCGHIFCLSCLFRFMSSTSTDDEPKSGKGARWKKCPICEDAVYLHEVKPVRFYHGQESPLPRPGGDVVLRLMARNAKSILALPREGGQEVLNSGEEIPWHFAANVLDYARIMKGTGDYIARQYDEEISALIKQEKEDELMFNQDNEWTQRAIRAINATKEKVVTIGGGEQAVPPQKGHSRPGKDADFYFYEAPPHVYLSPLDIRILKTKYGSFSSFPSTLLPTVEHIRSEVVDHDLRKRHKYLGHLPLGCVISFIECDWTDIVPSETLDTFAADIERRRRDHSEKAAQEERERIQAERIEAAALRASTGRRLEPLDEDSAPSMDLSEFAPLSKQPDSSPPDPRPGFETLASMSTSPSTQRTVWGTRVVSKSPELVASQPSVHDGWLRDEELFATSDLTMEVDAIETFEKGESSSVNAQPKGPNNRGGNGKKKKKQKITLMSTGGHRGN